MTLHRVRNLKPVCRKWSLLLSSYRKPGHNFNSNQAQCRHYSKSGYSNPQIRKYTICTLTGVSAIFGYLFVDYLGLKKKFFQLPTIFAHNLGANRHIFNFIADVSDVAAPAVVYIEIRDTKRFNQVTGQHIPISAGSGFIVKSDGLIMTNAHVIIQKMTKNSALKISIKLHDGRVFDAEVEAVDKESDLATLRIPCKNLPVIKIGRSTGLKPGEWVLALGSPLALSNTVTCGVVSAYRKSEELGLQKQTTVYIQTDASINNGNSGGPLMNVEGEAIGINSMNIIPGISFATPIDKVAKFLQDSRDEKKRMQIKQEVEQIRYVGIIMLTLTKEIIEELQRSNCGLSPKIKFGVLMQRILANSPAEE